MLSEQAWKDSQAVTDPNEVYQANLRRVQSEIDAQNALYNDMLNRSRIVNAPGYKARLAQNRIQQVQGGLVSSPMGEAQTTNIETANAQEQANAEALINERRDQALSDIRKEVRQSSAEEIKTRAEAKKAGTEAYLSEINARPERQVKRLSAAVKKLIESGETPDTMTPEEIKSFVDGLNVSEQSFKTELAAQAKEKVAAKAKLEQDAQEALDKHTKSVAETEKLNTEIAQGKWVTIGDGSMIYNPKTKETIANPKTFAPKETPDEKQYTSKTIPAEVKSTLIIDVKSADSKEELMQAYPKVDTGYLSDLYDELN
jgi:hypothetical protein